MHTENNVEGTSVPVNQNKSNSKTCLWFAACGCLLLVTCVAAIAIAAGLTYKDTSGSRKSGDRFFELIREDKIEEAYNSTDKKFTQNMELNSWKEFVQENDLKSNQNVYWDKSEFSNDNARIRGQMDTSKGKIYVMMDLNKVDGKWKIVGFNISETSYLDDKYDLKEKK